ncbi:MAG TPA: hypothetical protein VGJ32_17280 [Solirubrobacteraceae bacterium]|jgi:Ca2+-binding RTX toxin-like protein
MLSLAPAASAAEVTRAAGGALEVSDLHGAANEFIIERDTAAGVLRLRDLALPLALIGSSCTVVDEHEVDCDDATVPSLLIRGGGGDDTVTLVGANPQDRSVRVMGDGGQDVLTGGPGPEELSGGPGIDTVRGGEGDDTLWATGDGETVEGGPGDDTFREVTPVPAGPPDETLAGGPGFDVVDYSDPFHGAVHVALGDGVPTTGNGMVGESDTLDSVEGAIGTVWNDVLIGNSDDNFLDGAGGDDRLDGGDGNDDLYGGDGFDTLRGGAGDDYLLATEDSDQALGDTLVECGDGTDHFRGDFGLDVRPLDCELQLAQFTGPADLRGDALVGSTLTVTAPFIGTPAPAVETSWWSCRATCEVVGTGASYTTTANDVNREISARLVAVNDATGTDPGDPDVVWSERSVLVTSSPAAPGTPTPVAPRPVVVPRAPRVPVQHTRPVRTPTPPRPAPAPPAPVSALKALAAQALGGPVAVPQGGRFGTIRAYARAGRKGILRVGRRAVPALALLSRVGESVAVEQVLELTSRRSGHVRGLRVARRQVTLVPDAPAVERVHLSAAQRRLVRRARDAWLLVTIGGVAGRPPSPPMVIRLRLH